MRDRRGDVGTEVDTNQFADIKVIGVGGGGGNAVNRMIQADLKGVHFIAVNTDAQALEFIFGRTQGCRLDQADRSGCRCWKSGKSGGREPRRVNAEPCGADMVFVTAGMGGGQEPVGHR